MTFNKDLDLKISHIVKAPPSAVWEAWTKAEYMEKWFAPEPVVIAIQKHEFYEGGGLAWTMRLEDGTEFSGEHCFLKIVEWRAPRHDPTRLREAGVQATKRFLRRL